MNSEITPDNLLNWIRFTRVILDDDYCSEKINNFIKRVHHGTSKETSRRIYNKFWNCK